MSNNKKEVQINKHHGCIGYPALSDGSLATVFIDEYSDPPQPHVSASVGTYKHSDGVPTDHILHNRHCFDVDYDPAGVDWPTSITDNRTVITDETTTDDDVEDISYRESWAKYSDAESNIDLEIGPYDRNGENCTHDDNEPCFCYNPPISFSPRTTFHIDDELDHYQRQLTNENINWKIATMHEIKAINLKRMHTHQHEVYGQNWRSNKRGDMLPNHETKRVNDRQTWQIKQNSVKDIASAVMEDWATKPWAERTIERLYNQVETNSGTLSTTKPEDITIVLCSLYMLDEAYDRPTRDMIDAVEYATEISHKTMAEWNMHRPQRSEGFNHGSQSLTHKHMVTITNDILEQLDDVFDLPAFSPREFWKEFKT